MTSGPIPDGYFRITAPRFVVGLFISGGVVKEAALIIKYMETWSYNRVWEYCKNQGWELVLVKDGSV